MRRDDSPEATLKDREALLIQSDVLRATSMRWLRVVVYRPVCARILGIIHARSHPALSRRGIRLLRDIRVSSASLQHPNEPQTIQKMSKLQAPAKAGAKSCEIGSASYEVASVGCEDTIVGREVVTASAEPTIVACEGYVRSL
jgi:hypothetical protein